MSKIDYSKYKTTSAVPEASSMIETFRAIGYNIETAIADIIDNSISANAKNIWINFLKANQQLNSKLNRLRLTERQVQVPNIMLAVKMVQGQEFFMYRY